MEENNKNEGYKVAMRPGQNSSEKIQHLGTRTESASRSGIPYVGSQGAPVGGPIPRGDVVQPTRRGGSCSGLSESERDNTPSIQEREDNKKKKTAAPQGRWNKAQRMPKERTREIEKGTMLTVPKNRRKTTKRPKEKYTKIA